MIPLSISVNNFFSFDDAYWEWGEGLCLVEGTSNKGTQSSNGSGKSAFFVEALTWCLFDTTCRGLRYDEVIRKDQPSCIVTAVLDDGAKSYEIKRERKRGSGSRLSINDTLSTQEQLEQLIGIDYSTFASAIVHPQGSLGFADKKDSDRKSILTKALGLERFDLYKDRAKQLSQDNAKTIASLVASVNTLTGKISAKREALDNAAGQKETYETNRQSNIETEEKKQQQYQEAKVALNEKARRKRTLGIKAKSKRKEVDSLSDDIADKKNLLYSEESHYRLGLVVELNNADAQASHTRNEIANLRKLECRPCPTCLQTVTQESLSHVLPKIEEKLGQHEADVERITGLVTKKLDEIGKVRADLEELQKAFTVAHEEWIMLQAEHDAINTEQESMLLELNLQQAADRLEDLRKATNPFEGMANDLLAEINNLEFEWESVTKEQNELELLQQYWDFWVEGFGNKGIKSFILDSVVPDFTARANKYIQELTDNGVSIQMDTQTEKKSGGYSEKFSIIIQDGAGVRPYEAWSGGEKKRISVAIDLALSDLIATKSPKHWDFCVMDEVFESLDAEGKERAVALLEKLQRERRCLYVITHDSDMKGLFPKKITVTKNGDGVSKILGYSGGLVE